MTRINWRLATSWFRVLTARERAALACLGAAIGASIASWTWTLAAQAREEALELDARRAQVETVLAQARDRASQDEAHRQALKARTWSVIEASEGIARAEFLGAVQSAAAQAGLQNVSVTFEESPGAQARLLAGLSADFDWPSVLSLLRQMQAARLSFTINAIAKVRNGDGSALLQLSVSAPFLREEAPA